jgi:hypothetical protein
MVPGTNVLPGATTLYSLDGVGAYATANMMLGTANGLVFTSVNGGSVWYAPTKAPTGAPRPMIVIMRSDFLTSHTALAIAAGPVLVINDQSGVSLTQDAGVTFNQISLVNDSPDDIWALALGTSYTFAAGSRASTSTSIPFTAGGSFTVNTGVNTLDSFKITAANTGDQIQLTALAGAPVPQQVTVTGGVLGTDFNVTTGGGTYQIGNVFFLPSPGGFINLAALRNGAAPFQLQVNGSGVSGFPFLFLAVSVPYDPNGNVIYSKVSNATNDVGLLNFVLPNGTADVATVTQTSLPNGNVVPTIFESGTKPTIVTGGNPIYTITFGDPGDYVLFTATGTATNTGSWGITTGAPFSQLVTNGGGASVSAPGPGAYNLPNFTPIYSVVTLYGAGIDNVTVSGLTGGGQVYTAGVSRVFTFTSSSGTVTISNTTLTTQNITAAHTSGTIENYTGLSNLTGSLPGAVVLGAQINAVPAVTTYSNFIWRYELATGYWERVYYAANQTMPLNLAQISASGNALYFAAIGTTTVYESLNNGQTWAAMLFPTPTAINSLLAIDPTTVIVGGVANTYKSLFNGFWSASPVALGSITSLSAAPTNSAYIVAAGTTGQTSISSDTGTTWGTLSTAISGFSGNAMTSVFENGSTSAVYSIAANLPGVYRGTTRVDSPSPLILDSTAISVVNQASGLASGATAVPATNTVVYAQDNSSGDYAVSRITNLANPTGTSGYTAGTIAPTSGATGARGLWVQAAAGKNAIWSIYNRNSIREYIDYLAVTVAGVTAPAATVAATSAVVNWTAVTAGTFAASGITYQASITAGATALRSPYTSLALAGTYTGTATTATFTGLLPFTQYTVTVWVVAPLVSFGGSTAGVSTTFTTMLAAPVPVAPSMGAAFVPIVPSFAWSSVSGATGYELWISQSDPTFATKTILTVPVSGNPNSALNWTGTPLANNTTYYWEVRATAGTVVSAFSSVYGFTTVTAQLPAVTVTQVPPATLVVTSNPVPTIIISYPPVVTVTQAAANPAPVLTVTQPVYTIAAAETSTPTYIWIIVGIGALLTLAVIILIIRTRRVV